MRRQLGPFIFTKNPKELDVTQVEKRQAVTIDNEIVYEGEW